MTKLIRRVSFFILIVFQMVFLLAILFDKMATPLILSFIVGISILISIAYFKAPRDEEEHFLEDAYLILFAVLGAVATFYLNTKINLGSIISASLVGFIASFAPNFDKKSSILKEFPAAVYCGSFVGMTSSQVAPNIKFILFAGFIAGAILMLSKNIFNGFGGKLGTIAFGGVAITSVLIYLIF